MARTQSPAPARPRANEPRLPHADDVARVAYELFLQRGGVHGHDQEDWLKAERIVREGSRQRQVQSQVAGHK